MSAGAARVILPERLAGALFAELGRAMPNEGCGLLLGRTDGDAVRVTELAASPNVADDPAESFEIDPGLRLRTQRAARERGLEIVGHYHSHPFGDPLPSERDRARALEPELVWLILGLRWGGPQGLAAWRLSPEAEPVRLDLEIEEDNA
jgi:proteasome lid subunit RPN8/RPN11